MRAVDRIVLALAAFLLAETFFTWTAKRSAMVLGERVFAELRESFMTGVTALPLSTVERAGTGDLVARTTNDVEAISWSVRFAVPRMLVAAVTTLLTLGGAFLVGGPVALAMLVGVPLLWVSTRWYLRKAGPGYQREMAAYARLNGAITETVDGGRTVDALSLGRAPPHGRRRRPALLPGRRALHAVVADALVPGDRLRVPAAGGRRGRVGRASCSPHGPSLGVDVTIGQVTAVALYGVRLVEPMVELIEWLDELQVGAVALSRMIGIDEVAAGPHRRARRAAAGRPCPRPRRPVRLPAGHDVLHGVDLDLRPGERLAVVGPVGRGQVDAGQAAGRVSTRRPAAR